jgi:hypothetical protein
MFLADLPSSVVLRQYALLYLYLFLLIEEEREKEGRSGTNCNQQCRKTVEFVTMIPQRNKRLTHGCASLIRVMEIKGLRAQAARPQYSSSEMLPPPFFPGK